MGNICRKSLEKFEYLGISQEDGPESEWTRQNKAFEHNLMYRMVYFGGKGSLVAKAKKHGNNIEKMRKYIKNKIQDYLYRQGDGKELTKLEFAKYMQNNNYLAASKKTVKVQLSNDELIRNLERHEATVSFDKFEQHQVCWDLNKRGEVGETILHLCFLNNTEHHRTLAHTIMECYPNLALDIYEGPEYYGEGMLHMAIINNDIESVNILIDAYNVPINQRATGRFFCPKDLKDRGMMEKNLKKTKYEGKTYFGEYPLAFAASIGNTEIYDILINASLSGRANGEVDPNDQDTFGNTVLHMIVVHNQVNMFNYVANHNQMPANYEIRNKAGLTPLELSFELGRSQLFSNLLDLASVPQWSFGSITYAAYPLSFIDTIGLNGETNENSALRIIVRGETQEHLEMLDGEIINTLLTYKWKTYARGKFYFKFAWALVHLFLLSIAVYLRPKGDLLSSDPEVGRMARFNVCVVRWVTEVCVLIGCIANTIIEVREIISRGSIKSYLRSLYMMPAKSVFLIAIVLLYICIPLRLTGMKDAEESLLCIILPFSWCYILFFYRAMKRLGPFIHMIYEMLRGDLLRFSIIYAIFIFMFSQVFFFMYKETDEETNDTFATVHGSVMSVFKMTLGDFSDDLFDKTEHWFLSRLVFVLFAICLPILLLNMLIAMMGRTYTKIEQKAKREWRRQLAIIILNVERAISKKDLAKMRLKYSTEITVTRRRKKIVKRSVSRVESRTSVFDETSQVTSSRTNLVSLSTLYTKTNDTTSEDKDKQEYSNSVAAEQEEEVEETFRALMFLKRFDIRTKKNSKHVRHLWKKSVSTVNSTKEKGKTNDLKILREQFECERTLNLTTEQKEDSLPNVSS